MTTPLIEAIARAIRGHGDSTYDWEDFAPAAQAALTAITEAGCAVVPVEPTEAMQWAGWRAKDAIFSGDAEPLIAPSACYTAMISAAQGDG